SELACARGRKRRQVAALQTLARLRNSRVCADAGSVLRAKQVPPLRSMSAHWGGLQKVSAFVPGLRQQKQPVKPHRTQSAALRSVVGKREISAGRGHDVGKVHPRRRNSRGVFDLEPVECATTVPPLGLDRKSTPPDYSAVSNSD